MKKFSALAAVAFLVTTTGAFAQEAEAEAEDPNKKICRTEKMTGSLTRVRRTCMTRAQWSRLAEGTRRSVSEIERDANQGVAEAVRLRDSGQPRGDPMGF